MALLFFDGFDTYATRDDMQQHGTLPGWSYVNTQGFTAGRYGGQAIAGNTGTSGAVLGLGSNMGTAVVGFATKRSANPVSVSTLCVFYDAVNSHQVQLKINTAGQLVLYRGLSTVLATGTKPLSIGVWYYIEVKIVFSNTGSYEVKIDGVTEFSSGSADTTNTANNFASLFEFQGANGLSTFDDFYLDDANFLGPVRCTSLAPAGNDTPAQFDNGGGLYTARGLDRTGSITASTTLTILLGTIDNVVDGSISGASSANYVAFGNSQTPAKEIKFDFGSSTCIREARWYSGGSNTNGTWKWQGSHDDSAWTDIGAAFTLTMASAAWTTNTELSGNNTAYRYYRLLMTAGTTAASNFSIYEIEFAHAEGAAADFVNEAVLDAIGWVEGVSGEEHHFTLSNVTGAVTSVKGVQVMARANKTDAGALTMKLATDSGTESDGSTIALSEGALWHKRLLLTDPHTSAAWTAAALDALKIGVKLT